MRLYRLIVDGRPRYVGTQADARATKRDTGAAWTEIDVPTDKAGLLAFLDALHAPVAPAAAPAPPPSRAPQPRTAAALDAASVLARMDNPDLGLDAIVEAIAVMKGGYALKRIAGAVAIRFEELSR